MRRLHLALISCLALASSCAENDQTTKLADAQACMNDSTSETVSKCMSKLNGVSGARADLMRCGIKFMEEGFNESERIVRVMDELDNNDNSSPTVSAMKFLSFQANTDADVNLENAKLASDYCSQTEAAGFIKLASFAYIATSISKFGNISDEPTEAEIKNLLDQIASAADGDPAADAAKEAIGEAAVTTYTKSCEGVENPDKFCEDINGAIQGVDLSDSKAVGDALLDYLNAQSQP